jgi:hypothetical protein
MRMASKWVNPEEKAQWVKLAADFLALIPEAALVAQEHQQIQPKPDTTPRSEASRQPAHSAQSLRPRHDHEALLTARGAAVMASVVSCLTTRTLVSPMTIAWHRAHSPSHSSSTMEARARIARTRAATSQRRSTDDAL